MIKKNKTQPIRPSQTGFTMIEVLVVLAIAGLIILIVFLAVPALQRNSRNAQRTDDAARVVGAMQECLNNNRNSTSYCVTGGGVVAGGYLVLTDNLQLTDFGFVDPTDPDPVNLDAVDTAQNIGFDKLLSMPRRTCNDDGNNATLSGSTRNIAMMWQAETGSGDGDWRCLDVN